LATYAYGYKYLTPEPKYHDDNDTTYTIKYLSSAPPHTTEEQTCTTTDWDLKQNNTTENLSSSQQQKYSLFIPSS
jgi:hypothetical protein